MQCRRDDPRTRHRHHRAARCCRPGPPRRVADPAEGAAGLPGCRNARGRRRGVPGPARRPGRCPPRRRRRPRRGSVRSPTALLEDGGDRDERAGRDGDPCGRAPASARSRARGTAAVPGRRRAAALPTQQRADGDGPSGAHRWRRSRRTRGYGHPGERRQMPRATPFAGERAAARRCLLDQVLGRDTRAAAAILAPGTTRCAPDVRDLPLDARRWAIRPTGGADGRSRTRDRRMPGVVGEFRPTGPTARAWPR